MNTENVNSKMLKIVEQCYYQNGRYAIAKNQDL